MRAGDSEGELVGEFIRLLVDSMKFSDGSEREVAACTKKNLLAGELVGEFVELLVDSKELSE